MATVQMRLPAPHRQRLIALAEASGRTRSSLGIFALNDTLRYLRKDPERAWEALHDVKTSGPGEPISPTFGDDGLSLIAAIRDIVEQATGARLGDSAVMRAVFTLWLNRHSDDELLAVLGVLQPETAV